MIVTSFGFPFISPSAISWLMAPSSALSTAAVAPPGCSSPSKRFTSMASTCWFTISPTTALISPIFSLLYKSNKKINPLPFLCVIPTQAVPEFCFQPSLLAPFPFGECRTSLHQPPVSPILGGILKLGDTPRPPAGSSLHPFFSNLVHQAQGRIGPRPPFGGYAPSKPPFSDNLGGIHYLLRPGADSSPASGMDLE